MTGLRILGASVDFGFGSSGKLSAILGQLPAATVVLADSTHSRQVIESKHVVAQYGQIRSAGELLKIVQRHSLSAAVVVLNHGLAELCYEIGLPTVFIDSLPFLWTDHDQVFHHAVEYCAQWFPVFPQLCWQQLRSLENLSWVEGIVPGELVARRVTRDAYAAVVNFGGIGTHLLRAGESHYPGIIGPAVLGALIEAGYRRVTFVGNVRAHRYLGEMNVPAGVEVRVEPCGHERFQELMTGAGLLLTSPGLTTIIESGATRTPTVVLPPQNVSQFLNADGVLGAFGPRAAVVCWPDAVIRRSEVEEVRARGEDAALEVVYAAVAAAAGDPAVQNAITGEVNAKLQAAEGFAGTEAYVEVVGTGGAGQVAARVMEHFA